MTRTKIALAGAVALTLTGPALAQVTTGGAANTGVAPPPVVGGVPAGTVRSGTLDSRVPARSSGGNAANRSNSSVPGTTPDVNIGGTPTSGPPGTGGAAGGPSLGN